MQLPINPVMRVALLALALLLPLVSTVGADSMQDEASYCSDRFAQEPLVDTVAFFAAFERERATTLEENEEVLTVYPRITADRAGELLVVDPPEAQVRLYRRDGSLVRVIGRRGEGPGEFRAPMSAARAMDDRIVVTDPMLSRISFFSPDGAIDSSVGSVPLAFILGAMDLGADRFLLLGPGGDDVTQPRFLHIWDAEAERIERSFLPMGLPEASRAAGSSFLSVSASVETDTIWAAWALSDTLYKFNRSGQRLGVVPMPLSRPTGPVPSLAGPEPVNLDAIGAITQVTDLFLLDGGHIAVQSGRSRGRDFEFDLLIMDRLGQPELQLIGTPRLLLVDRDEFYFDDPASLSPNRLIVARRRGAP